jgi:hypothetical protein
MNDDNYYGFVYLWVNNHPDANKHSKYIGQHIGTTDDGYIGSGTIFIKRYHSKKYKGFWTRVILEYCENIDELNEAEAKWINKYNAVISEQFCNCRFGGKNGKHSLETKLKISASGKGRISWNVGKSTGKQSKEIVEKRLKSIALTKEKQFESDYNNILHYINEKGSIKCVQHLEVDINTRKKMITRINRLVADSKIKQFWFGANDVRYTLPDFSLETLITSYISSNVDVNRKDITQYLHQAVGITKRKVSTTITELIKEECIIQYRGYRTNYYKVADNKKIKTK